MRPNLSDMLTNLLAYFTFGFAVLAFIAMVGGAVVSAYLYLFRLMR